MICTRCHRTLLRPPVFIEGLAYGRRCAEKAPRKPEASGPDLLTGIDLDGAELIARQTITQTIEASAARHLGEMRASWGRA